MNTETKSSKPNLREEFRQWFHAAPRVWLIIGMAVLLAIIFRDVLSALAATALFLALVALVLGALFVLPAVIGAVAGSTVGNVVRWVRHRRYRKQMRRYTRRAVNQSLEPTAVGALIPVGFPNPRQVDVLTKDVRFANRGRIRG